MMKIYIILIIFLLGFSISRAEVSKMFGEELLNNPKTYKEKLEALFSYHEIEIFQPTSMVNTVILENGYARSSIINKDAWVPGVSGREVKRIDIIFTKYPVKKEDWITNYYDLLVDRLIELFAIDPDLNNENIEWNLVLQTDCKNAWEAKQFFHGILIVFENISIEIKKTEAVPEKVQPEVEKNFKPVFEDTTEIHSVPEIKVNQSFIEFEKKRRKQSKKPKLKNLPDCPSFKRKRIFGIF